MQTRDVVESLITFENSPSPRVLRWGYVNTEKELIASIKLFSKSTRETKAAFTPQTKVGKLVLANSSWRVWTAQKHAVGKHVLFVANSLPTSVFTYSPWSRHSYRPMRARAAARLFYKMWWRTFASVDLPSIFLIREKNSYLEEICGTPRFE